MILTEAICRVCQTKFKFKIDLERKTANGSFIRRAVTGQALSGRNRCLSCQLKNQRVRRAENKNAATHKYEKTVNGHMMRTYRNMLSRITGIQKKKHHLYSGKQILSKEEFYKWTATQENYLSLYSEWRARDYDQRLTPSVDRIDPRLGYVPENMRWTTHSENSAAGARSKYRRRSQ